MRLLLWRVNRGKDWFSEVYCGVLWLPKACSWTIVVVSEGKAAPNTLKEKSPQSSTQRHACQCSLRLLCFWGPSHHWNHRLCYRYSLPQTAGKQRKKYPSTPLASETSIKRLRDFANKILAKTTHPHRHCNFSIRVQWPGISGWSRDYSSVIVLRTMQVAAQTSVTSYGICL